MPRYTDFDALMEKLEELYNKCEKDAYMTGNRGASVTWNDSVAIVKSAPTVDDVPDRKAGKWIHGKELGREMIGDCITAIFYEGWQCSECGCTVEEERQPTWRFCPNCGADMQMKSQEEV